MLVCTMMRNKRLKSKQTDKILALLIILISWKLLTLFFSPLVVPTIGNVVLVLADIITSLTLLKMIMITMVRLICGLTIGVVIGLFIGILMGNFARLRGIISPLVGVLQTVPPVSWVVLALVWFGFNGRPAVFIVVTATIPVIAINICEGIVHIDQNLMQMAQLYNFSGKKKLRHIIFPSIKSYFISAFKMVLGSGWKIAVMGEVLTTNDGIGGMIKLARLNIEPESIIAWSVIIVSLFYIFDFFISKFFFREEGKYVDS